MTSTNMEIESEQESPKRKWSLRLGFVGAQGIRSGWSMLIFLAIIIAQLLLTRVPVNHLLHYMKQKQGLETWSVVVAIAIPALLVFVATAIMAKIEKRPVLSYGFMGDRKLWRFAVGIAGGIAALSALVLALKMSGFLIFDSQMLHGRDAWTFGLKWGLAFLLTGVFEESLLRGYLQSTLTRGMGFWWAALLLSVGFGVLHLSNKGESPIGIFSAAGNGLVFCLSLWLTKSLYWAVGLHSGWDWAQSYLFGVSNSGQVSGGHLFATHPSGALLWSGGATGPEGSIYVIPTMAIIALGVWLAWSRSEVGREPAAISAARP
jgi:uncharacterized protein